MTRYDFSRLDDGIDWANAIPPHALPLPPPPLTEAQRANQHNPTLVFNWPLPEEHPAFAARERRPQPSGTQPSRRAVEGTAGSQPSATQQRHMSRREMLQRREQQIHHEWNGEPVNTATERRRTQHRRMHRQPVQAPVGTRSPSEVQPMHPQTPPTTVASSLSTYTELIRAQREAEQEELLQLEEIPPLDEQPPPAPVPTVSPVVELPPLPSQQPPSRSPPPTLVRPQQQGLAGRWELTDFSYEGLLELGSLAVPTGLDKQQLAGYKAVPYAPKAVFTRGIKDEVECAICLEQLQQRQPSLWLPCGHVYHHSCIVTWLSKTNKCPSCRFEIPRKVRR